MIATPEPTASFIQHPRVASNQATLCAFTGAESFWDAIASLQHKELRSADVLRERLRADQPVPLLWLDSASDVLAPAIAMLMGSIEVTDDALFDKAERAVLEAAYNNALLCFARWLPETYLAFRGLTVAVVCGRRAGYSGGTVSSRLGLIWLSPEPSWSDQTWVEHLLHEYVHNALFLEDMIHGVLTAGGVRLAEPDALALSAIRQVRRGYDKAYHSAFVSFALVQYYLRTGEHDEALALLYPLMSCLDDLRRNLTFLTPHGIELLKDLIGAALHVWRSTGGGSDALPVRQAAGPRTQLQTAS